MNDSPDLYHTMQGVNPYLGTTTKFASAQLVEWAQQTCNKYYLQALSRELLPDKRIRVCMRMVRPGVSKIDVLKHKREKRATFGGVARCASIWDCPVCSSTITEQRRRELQTMLSNTVFDVVMITYTMQHKKNQPLQQLLLQLGAAYRKTKSGRKAVQLKNDYHWVGSIRAFEITHGSNGWHPHYHELMLSEYLPKTRHKALQADLGGIWREQLRKCGAWGNSAALDVTPGDNNRVKEYVAKYGHMPTKPVWDTAAEMTKQPGKTTARAGGRTPLQILADYGAGDIASGKLWQEYSAAVHGKAQLVWSRGLRELLEMDENMTDEAIVQSEEENTDYELLTTLDLQQWKIVRDYNLQSAALTIAATGDIEALHKYINEYRW